MEPVTHRKIQGPLLILLACIFLVTSCEGTREHEPEPVEYSEETQRLIRIIIGGGTTPIGGVPDRRIGEVRSLLEAGADPNARQDFLSRRDGWPRLMLRDAPLLSLAARFRQPVTIQALLEAGADVNARDSSGATALHYAMYQANHNDPAVTEVLELLLKNGADPNIATYDDGESRFRGEGRYRDGHAPLYRAAEALSSDWVSLLIVYGAEVNAAVADHGNTDLASGGTAIHAVINGLAVESQSLLPQAIETLRILLESGANPNIRRATHGKNLSSDGATPLFLSTVHGFAEIVELLIEYGADPNIALAVIENHRSAWGSAPLHAAQTKEVASMLIEAGAKVDIKRQDATKEQPVHIATYAGWNDVVSLLLAHGADINAIAEDGTPVDYAEMNRQHDTVEYLRSRGGLSREELQESE